MTAHEQSYTLLSVGKAKSLLSFLQEMRQWICENDIWGAKKSSQSQTDPDFKHKEEQHWSQERTVTLKKERRIGFALSAFVLCVCELWLKTEDSLSTLGPFCPIVSRPLPYPPTQKIPAGAQSDAHPLCCALSERADPVQTQTHRDQTNYAQVLTEETGSEIEYCYIRSGCKIFKAWNVAYS